MLVLTRKTDQSITLGDPASTEEAIEVTVIEIRGDQVRLGIKAAHHVAVHRKEVYLQIQEENEAASQTAAEALPAVPAGKPGSTVGLTLEELRRRESRQ